MKRFTLLAALGLCSISLFAQDAQKEEPKEEGFVFTTVKELPITSVKNQSRAGQHRGVRHSQLCMTTIKEMNMKE